MLMITPGSNEQVRIDTPSGPIVISVRVRPDRKGMLAIAAPHAWKISREAKETPLTPGVPVGRHSKIKRIPAPPAPSSPTASGTMTKGG